MAALWQRDGGVNPYRGMRYYPGLEGLARVIDKCAEPITDRGLTGPAARDGQDVRGRIAKQKAKLARRAARASRG